MKKSLALLLSLGLMLSLVACKNTSTQSDAPVIEVPPMEETSVPIPAYLQSNWEYKFALLGVAESSTATSWLYGLELLVPYSETKELAVDPVNGTTQSKLTSLGGVVYGRTNTFLYDDETSKSNETRRLFMTLTLTETKQEGNTETYEDLSFILHNKDWTKGQTIEVNCDREEMSLDTQFLDEGALVLIDDDYLIISNANGGTQTEKTQLNSVEGTVYTIEHQLDYILVNGDPSTLLFGTETHFYDHQTLEEIVLPEGCSAWVEVDSVPGAVNTVQYHIFAPDALTPDFANLLQHSTTALTINEVTYKVDNY